MSQEVLLSASKEHALIAQSLLWFAHNPNSLHRSIDQIPEDELTACMAALMAVIQTPEFRMVARALFESIPESLFQDAPRLRASLNSYPPVSEEDTSQVVYHALKCFLGNFPQDSVDWIASRVTKQQGTPEQKSTAGMMVNVFCTKYPGWLLHFGTLKGQLSVEM